jgi:hypothetical protein
MRRKVPARAEVCLQIEEELRGLPHVVEHHSALSLRWNSGNALRIRPRDEGPRTFYSSALNLSSSFDSSRPARDHRREFDNHVGTPRRIECSSELAI